MAAKTLHRKRPERLLTANERQGLERDLAHNEAMISATDKSFGEGNWAPVVPEGFEVSKGKLKEKSKHIRQVLEEGAPDKETDQKRRDDMYKRRKELERQFIPYLETWEDIHARPGTGEYNSAIRKAVSRPKVNHLINEWKRLGLLLEPDDPTVNDLDSLRARA